MKAYLIAIPWQRTPLLFKRYLDLAEDRILAAEASGNALFTGLHERRATARNRTSQENHMLRFCRYQT
jgi:hypothetical protein